MRPVQVLPKYGSYPTVVAVMENGSTSKSPSSFSLPFPPSLLPPYQCTAGAGISFKIASKRPFIPTASSLLPSSPLAIPTATPTSSVIHPPLALPNKVLYSICSSSAPNASNKSINSSSVSPLSNLPMLSDRSALLSTTMGLSPRERARERTYLVWDLGPSAASTTRTMPSTVERMRSTSPAKSAWPGVSTTLIIMCSLSLSAE
mmetsp:Transcript_24650/g.49824  ORF Transcript_24650/g.49824 Transcript_24650/m.49824 type:complete len:204 (-) Transcript_24650:840-1451(-)